MPFKQLKHESCPVCGRANTLWLHPGGRVCGCDHCQTVFNYPSMIEIPVQNEQEKDGIDYFEEYIQR